MVVERVVVDTLVTYSVQVDNLPDVTVLSFVNFLNPKMLNKLKTYTEGWIRDVTVTTGTLM